MGRFEHHFFICENLRDSSDSRGSCAMRGSHEIRKQMKAEIKKRGLKNSVRANQAGCMDACEFGPVVVVYPQNVWYGGVKPEDVTELLDTHLNGEGVVERLLIKDPKFNK